MSTKTRLGWIDMIKGISMITILLCHMDTTEIVTRFYMPFYLTAFFFVSGYTFRTRDSFKLFLTNKTRVLLIPLFSFGLLNNICNCIENKSIERFLPKLLGNIIQRSLHNDYMWFLACLFTTLIIFYAIVKFCKDSTKKIIFISAIIMILGYIYTLFNKHIEYISNSDISLRLPWQFEIAMVMEIWLALGYLYKKYEDKLQRYVTTKVLLVLVFIYSGIVSIYNNTVDIRLEEYRNIPVFLLSSLIGISILVILTKHIEHNKILEFIGKNSLVYYAVHAKFIKVINKLFNKIGFVNEYSWVLCCVFTIIILVPVVLIINRYFSFVLGKNRGYNGQYIFNKKK